MEEIAPLVIKRINLIRRRTSRPCKYPFQMVIDARVMRDNGYEYREIQKALNEIYGTDVKMMTVRDWAQSYYRVLR